MSQKTEFSLKAELETWAAALKAYDEEDFEKSLDLFSQISDSSKILTNMGLIYATLGDHESAIERFIQATQLDQFLAVAYFQCGVSNFLLARYDLALKDFQEALLYLRGNQAINYEQIGLKFMLYSAEVLFNKGLCQVYLGNTQEGLSVMDEARREKTTDDHNVIDDAIKELGEGYTIFSIPVGVLYRPSENKLKNAKTKDYMGKAKLVAASDTSDIYTTFTGATRLQQGLSPSGAFVERPTLDTEGSPVVGLGRTVTSLPTISTDIKPKTSPSLASSSAQRSPTTSSEPAARKPRVNTMLYTAKASPNATIGGPPRAFGVKPAPINPAPTVEKERVVTPPAKENEQRLTVFYDNYLESYTEEAPPPPPDADPSPNSDRVAAWARGNPSPNNATQRAPSRNSSSTSSLYVPNPHAARRRLSRRQTARSRAPISMYEEEEEGYGSGEEGPFELTKIRIKLHYQDDVRGMAVTPDMPFEEFVGRVATKFGRDVDGLQIKFKDEDGGKVTLRDESDYDLAIETARESAKGKPEGKLEIWCLDV